MKKMFEKNSSILSNNQVKYPLIILYKLLKHNNKK